MDSILAIGVGLGLRALIDTVIDGNITASALVGIWEGIVLNHFLLKHRSSFDPYVAFGFRLFVDFMFTESFARMTMTVMWAFLGMVFADLGGDLSKDRRFRRIWRRVRHTFPFLEHMSRSRPSRVRFTSGGSSSSTTSGRTPQLPLRPTATPFPGTFDQWSVASSEIGGPTASVNEPIRPAPREPRRTESIRTARESQSRRPDSVVTTHTTHTTYTNRTSRSEPQRSEPPARSPSELEYLTLPVIPDPEPSPVEPRFRDRDNEPINSGLTTPADDPSSRNLPDEDRPIIHSGLTTPEHHHTTIMPTSEGLPPVRVISDEHEHTPSKSQLDLPPVPIRPPFFDEGPSGEPSDPHVPFPEPHVPPALDLTDTNAFGLGLVPPIAEIPSIPTPSFETEHAPNRDTLVDPPPQYEEPIKDVPDHVSVAGSDGAGAESVISGTSRTAMITRADELRQQAQAQEKVKGDYKVALDRARREKRYWDVLWYEGEIEDAELKAKEFNAKAAHRYFKGTANYNDCVSLISKCLSSAQFEARAPNH